MLKMKQLDPYVRGLTSPMQVFGNWVGRLRLFVKLLLALCTAYCACAGSPLQAQTKFLLNPTPAEIASLAGLFEATGRVVPVSFIYDAQKRVRAWGVPISTVVRNGIHARLALEAGLIKSLGEAPANGIYQGGTLFLELVDGKPVLAYHGWNSARSTMNVGADPVKREVLQDIANHLGATIQRPSEKLQALIDNANIAKYGEGSGGNRNKIGATAIYALPEPIQPTEPPPPNSDAMRAKPVSEIKAVWGGGDFCTNLSNGL
jgi:hypothetical protein